MADHFGWSTAEVVKLIKLSYDVVQAFRHGPEQVASLAAEFEQFARLLERYQNLQRRHDLPFDFQSALKTLEEAQGAIAKYADLQSGKITFSRFKKTGQLMFNDQKLKELQNQITRELGYLNFDLAMEQTDATLSSTRRHLLPIVDEEQDESQPDTEMSREGSFSEKQGNERREYIVKRYENMRLQALQWHDADSLWLAREAANAEDFQQHREPLMHENRLEDKERYRIKREENSQLVRRRSDLSYLVDQSPSRPTSLFKQRKKSEGPPPSQSSGLGIAGLVSPVEGTAAAGPQTPTLGARSPSWSRNSASISALSPTLGAPSIASSSSYNTLIGMEPEEPLSSPNPVALSTPGQRIVAGQKAVPADWTGMLTATRRRHEISIEIFGLKGQYRTEHVIPTAPRVIPHTETDPSALGILNISFLDSQKVLYTNLIKRVTREESCNPVYKFQTYDEWWKFQEYIRGLRLMFCRESTSVTSNLRSDARRHLDAESRYQDIRLWLDARTGDLSCTFLSHSQSLEENRYRYVEKRIRDFEPISAAQTDPAATNIRLSMRRSRSPSGVPRPTSQRKSGVFNRRRSSGTAATTSTATPGEIEWLEIAFGSSEHLQEFVQAWTTVHEPEMAEAPSESAIAELPDSQVGPAELDTAWQEKYELSGQPAYVPSRDADSPRPDSGYGPSLQQSEPMTPSELLGSSPLKTSMSSSMKGFRFR